MRTIVLVLSLMALAAPSYAAAKAKGNGDNDATHCREMAGKEVGEGEMRSGINRHIVQRWSDCMMGMPHAR
jgi:hypothetical protein